MTSHLRRNILRAALAGGLAMLAAAATGAASAQTLEQVQRRGELRCGSHLGLPGFGQPDAQGRWRGLDVDFCRAIAAAIFNDPNRVMFVPTTSATRFVAVQSGEVDILSRNATYTMSRDTQLRLNFPAITFFDGQGFMAKRSLNVTSVRQMGGATFCVAQGTTTEMNLADFARTNGLRFDIVAFATTEEGLKATEAGRCDAFTTDRSGLAGERLKLARADDFVILDEVISKEPLGPAVRHGDEQWTDIVRWTHYAMLNAEELGVTSANVEQMLRSTNPDIRRLLGVEGTLGEHLGLSRDWAYRIIRHVGNYAEIYDRNVGKGSLLKIERGLNALHSAGGVQYAFPMR